MADELSYSSRPDYKRKHEDHSVSPPIQPRRPTGFSAPIGGVASPDGGSGGAPASYNSVPPVVDGFQLAKQRAQEIAARLFSDAEAKRPKVENGGGGDDLGEKGFSSAVPDHSQKPLPQQIPSVAVQSSFPSYGYPGSNKKIEIPNGRVGVIIGKGGETIKYLQLQSGAKIQVTRDMDADPNSQTRMVELVGTSEQVSKAEQLINDVLAEAESGGSAGVAARKVGSVQVQPGAEQFQMKVPNNKVGLVIGKGGETIKSMQANSGARIQVIPLHLPPGDPATERTLYIDGTTEQIEAAKQLVNEVISENRVRNSAAGGYSNQGYRPPQQPNWGPPMQQPGYGYMQPGAYPGPPPQYNTTQTPYGTYPSTASGGYSTGWDQTTNQPTQPPAPASGYDYYNQQQSNQQQTVGGSTAADGTNYSYGQPPSYPTQGSYGDSTYSQTTAGQQQGYGYHTGAPQPGYSQPLNATGYDQQGYGSAPGYGTAVNPSQDGSTATYGAQGGVSQMPPTQPVVPAQLPPNQPGYPAQGSAPSGYGSSPYGNPSAQSGYSQSAPTQPSYGGPPQAQKQPAQAVYGQPAPVPAGYGQVPQAQSGYAQDSTHHPPAGYGQQPYGDTYSSGGYSQPSTYSSDNATHAPYDATAAAPAASAGATKASPS